MNKTGFLFDLDGVLIDSEKEYTRIWQEIDKAFPTGKENFPLLIKGQTLPKILNENFPMELRDKVNDMLHNLENRMSYSYCPGAEDFLDFLLDNNAKVAVVTSSDDKKMAHLYAEIPDFKSRISLIVDSSKIKNSKPHPEGYLLAASLLGVNIEDCIVFEDSVQGVMAGKASGARVVGIVGTKTREELEPFCNVVVNSIDEARTYLKEILK